MNKTKSKEPISHEDSTVFIDFFGDYPIVRVLDFLLMHRIFDYSKREIAENSDIGISTLNLFWGRLIERGIVMETRKPGKGSLYALNQDSPIVQELIELNLRLCFGLPQFKEKKKVAIEA